MGRGERGPGLGLPGLGVLTSAASCLRVPAVPAARRRWPSRRSCWPPSARRAGCRRRRSRPGGRNRPPATHPHPGSSPRLRWERRTTSGSSRSNLRSITLCTLIRRMPGSAAGSTAQPHNGPRAALVRSPMRPATMDAMLDLSEAPPVSDPTTSRRGGIRAGALREVGPPCTAAHRAGRPADRRDGHRAAVPATTRR